MIVYVTSQGKLLYKQWRDRCADALPAREKALMKFLLDQRNVEVHERGSGREVELESAQFTVIILIHRVP